MNIPGDVMQDLLRYRAEFDLSNRQMAEWLLSRHGIKISIDGLRKQLARQDLKQ